MGSSAKKSHGARWALPAVLLTAGLLWAGNFTLGITEVDAPSKNLPAGFDGFRIALITDLHGRTFGKNNDALVEKTCQAKPDLIALAGDIADETSDLEELAALLPRLANIAPCYYVTGNHEWRMENRKEWFRLLEQCGITRLENEFVTLSRGEDTIVLAGVDAYTIVLCHRNDQLERMARLSADLVLSGHAHGGVVRLPFVGAIFGTHYEFFPDYTAGLYTFGRTSLVVSRGLGGSRRIPVRIGNRPEIPVITLRRA